VNGNDVRFLYAAPIFPSDLKPLKAVFSSKKPEYRAFFPEKVVLNMIVLIRDNLRADYLLKYPDYPFAIVTIHCSEKLWK
jgi:hypothetical protein